MKVNPYIYPYIPFMNLSNKKNLWRLKDPKIFTFIDLKKFLLKIRFPLAKITGRTLQEKIINIFLDRNFLYGPAENIIQNKEIWLEKIKYFSLQNKPILFTIHGFPFKIPCPLKTDRRYPDLGEILSLLKLFYITKSIDKIYQPGAEIFIIGEGAFAKFTSITKKEWIAYRNYLKQFISKLNLDKKIHIIDLIKLEQDRKFNKTFKNYYKNLKYSYKNNDKEVNKKINSTLDSVFRIISTRNYSDEKIMDIYNDKVKTPKILKIRNDLKKMAFEAVFKYHTYLMTRDSLNFVESQVPHSLPLTVSPKLGRIGIYPISPNCTRLPYHGVPIYNQKNGRITIEYLIDIKRTEKEYIPVYLKKDKEDKPLFYIQK